TDDASDAILAYLNGKLQELLAPLNGAAEQLAGVDSPTEAIRRGVSDAWRTFANAGEQYRELVDAQTVVLMSDPDRYDASQSQRSEDRRANTARMRNLDEVWPEWSVPARDSLDGYLTFVDTPWPVGDDGFLLWCVRN